ncbi:profilin-4 isoform X1 [Labeo rohita]|uniref:profilin-4 isoform X1 n=1 Tax=Labeo rohita TaxID=84645 RepID=UPI0021E3014B|nr:profilin-4 isoform X1 [Labeo rohita]
MNPFPKLLEECLNDTKHVECAAIFVAKTGDVKAASNLTVCPEQTQMFLDAFKQVNLTRQTGLNFRNKHYTCVRADRHSIYTKCEGHGLILVRTAFYVIVATYSQSMYPSICVEAVEKLAEYLREKGK